MRTLDLLQVLIYLFAIVIFTPVLGSYMAAVFEGRKTFALSVLGWLEKAVYRSSGIDENESMDFIGYTKALIYFNLFGFIFLFALQMFQKSSAAESLSSSRT